MKWKYLYNVLLVLCCITILSSAIGDDDVEHLPHYYVLKTRGYFAKNEWKDGKKVLDEGLKTYPDDPDMHWLMGVYYYQYKDYDQSRYQLIKCIEKEYNHVEAKQLLVNVEEQTKHYSSAICYVNELLEVNPYWRGLWRRKIELYRKQGNDIEANRLLKRISQIYPNDSILRRDLDYTLEMEYIKQKKSGNIKDAINSLEELIKDKPHNEGYYYDLTNLYLQQGLTEKALEMSSQGVQDNPTSTRLVVKKVSILSEQCRYPEAMAFLKERMRISNSPVIHQMYNNILEDAARSARDSDPYILYGKIYATNKSKEALDYLLSTSLTRGYNDDAKFYLKEAKKRYGVNNRDILYKEYMLDVRMGNEREANGLLQRLYKESPNNYDIVYAMCLLRLNEAEKYMINNDWGEALPCVQFVVRKSIHDKELQRSAMEKMLTCYTEMRRYNEALSTLDTLSQRIPDYTSYVDKKSFLLDKMGRTNEALDLYYNAYHDSTDLNKEIYASAYEEMAIPYIKRLIQSGETRRAYDASIRLLEIDPSSDLGLRYAINTSALLGRYDEFGKYTKIGLAYYPNDIFYKIKEATALNKSRKYDESLNLLRPELENYPDNSDLVNAYAENSESLALQLIKKDSTQLAMQVLDSALKYNENNKELKYAKGLVYEKMKIYDSAYVYQKFYQPAIAEIGEYNQHMRGLQNKSFKNEVGLEYLHARFANEDVISSIASAEYSRKKSDNIYTARINYKGMDGNNSEDSIAGGTGIQLQGEWTHKFAPTVRGMVNLAWANKYFSTWAANMSLMKDLKNDWEATLQLGYRRLTTSRQYIFKPVVQGLATDTVIVTGPRNLFLLSPGVSKIWYPVWANAKLDLISLGSKFYYNMSGQARFYLNDDGKTYISAMAGVGTFPEISVVDNSLIRQFSHTNTMVGLGGQLLVNKYLSFGLLGTWYTYYNQRYSYDSNANLISTTHYKNLYNVYFQVYINF